MFRSLTPPPGRKPLTPIPCPRSKLSCLRSRVLGIRMIFFSETPLFLLVAQLMYVNCRGEKSIKEKIKTTRTTMTHRLPSTFRYRKINTEKKSFHCETFSCYFSLRRSHDDFLIIINTFKPFKIIFISLCLQKWYMFVAQKSNNGDVYGTEHKSPHSLLLD